MRSTRSNALVLHHEVGTRLAANAEGSPCVCLPPTASWIAACVAALGGCATKPGSMAEAYRDPYEKFNRKVYALNKGLDKYALLPGAKVYPRGTPAALRRGIAGGLSNLDEPLSFINSGLQAKPRRAGRTLDALLRQYGVRGGRAGRRRDRLGAARAEGGFRPDLRRLGLSLRVRI